MKFYARWFFITCRNFFFMHFQTTTTAGMKDEWLWEWRREFSIESDNGCGKIWIFAWKSDLQSRSPINSFENVHIVHVIQRSLNHALGYAWHIWDMTILFVRFSSNSYIGGSGYFSVVLKRFARSFTEGDMSWRMHPLDWNLATYIIYSPHVGKLCGKTLTQSALAV